MKTYKLTAKEIVKNLDWTVKIRTKWQGETIDKDVKLPKYIQEGVIENIERYIKEGKTVEKEIYLEQSGSDVMNIEKVEAHI